MASRRISKPGKYGTLYLFRVAYSDGPHGEYYSGTVRLWAYDADHARDRFYEAPDGDGWEIESIEFARREASRG